MDQACPLPSPQSASEQEMIKAMLAMKRIAVVGASMDPMRAGNYVPAYLMERGKEIVPVNPNHMQVLGKKSYRTLALAAEAASPMEVVLVFRRAEHCAGVAQEAAAVGAKGIWLQSGIVSKEARKIARDAGMLYVEDRCMMVEMGREG